ncbi:hypothetical protein SAMN04488021_101303 [Paracoccus aminovorans]|uniref:Uncharacterized protein n=1 Tax=Paracoccus aminovorans TaxID=34004 RepID=A0A1I2XH17_9RHOB|nr:hypothetical protein JCM7685_1148 [Paracoccus aminovorans]SFH12319.1 hypothetical protein SAMN04488021_101303 [Paracoccus aminovorans]
MGKAVKLLSDLMHELGRAKAGVQDIAEEAVTKKRKPKPPMAALDVIRDRMQAENAMTHANPATPRMPSHESRVAEAIMYSGMFDFPLRAIWIMLL